VHVSDHLEKATFVNVFYALSLGRNSAVGEKM